MPNSTKKLVCECTPLPYEDPEVLDSQEGSISSDQEQDVEVSVHPSLAYPAHPVPQVILSMCMPYIEDPRMDWTVNDGLHHRFLKLRLKWKNIFENKLAVLAEKQQCKKVITWSSDLGMD